MEQIVRGSKIIYKLLSILFWIIVVASAVGLVLTLCQIFFFPPGTLVFHDTFLKLGNVELGVAEALVPQFTPGMYAVTLVTLLVGTGFSCYTVRLLQKIFAPMAEGRPFDGSVSKMLRKLAWVTLIFGIVSYGLSVLEESAIFRAFDLPSLLLSDKITSCRLSIVNNGDFPIFFALLLLLSHIFRYGEALQQQSDETL